MMESQNRIQGASNANLNPQKKRNAAFRQMIQEVWVLNLPLTRGTLVAQMVKHLPAMRETRVQSLGWDNPLEKEMATHSSTLAWKIPWIEEPGRLQSMGSQRVRRDWATSQCQLHAADTNSHLLATHIARYYGKFHTLIISFTLHNNPVREMISISLFSKYEKTEAMFCCQVNLFKDTQLERDRGGIPTLASEAELITSMYMYPYNI